jgi:phosphatidylglycerophosphate synthase
MVRRFVYLTPVGRQGLNVYKYKSGGYTPLDTLLNAFWQWCVTFVPLWVAPNVITLLGLLCNVAGCAVMLYSSPTLDKTIPPWANIFCGITLFIYQTMDAMDGKQARRTKSSSALGQLFDHGCDAVSTLLSALSLCACLGAGPYWTLTFITFSVIAFFTAQWNEYYTHVLSTNVFGLFGVSEAQWTIIAVHLFSAFQKEGFWNQVILPNYHVPFMDIDMDIKYNSGLIFFTIGISVLQWILSSATVVQMKGLQAFKTQLPVALIFILYFALIKTGNTSNAPLERLAPLPHILIGLCMSLISSRIIVEGLCKMQFDPWHPAAVGCLGMAIALFYVDNNGTIDIIQDHLWVVFSAFVVVMYSHYVYH